MREKMMMIVMMVAVSLTSALLLAAVNGISKDTIEKNRMVRLQKAVLDAIEIPLAGRDIADIYTEMIREINIPEGTLFLAGKGGKGEATISGAAFHIRGPGFWGPISMVIGIDPDTLNIRGIEIIDQEETPGLGARIEEEEFRGQFKGKTLGRPIGIRAAGADLGANDVSAITGATISCKAVEKIINGSSAPFTEALKGVRNG